MQQNQHEFNGLLFLQLFGGSLRQQSHHTECVLSTVGIKILKKQALCLFVIK